MIAERISVHTFRYSSVAHLGFSFTVAVGYLGDGFQQRGYVAISSSFLTLIGFAILISDLPSGAKHAGTFLAAMGSYACIPTTIE